MGNGVVRLSTLLSSLKHDGHLKFPLMKISHVKKDKAINPNAGIEFNIFIRVYTPTMKCLPEQNSTNKPILVND
jgi:hypothetical protein